MSRCVTRMRDAYEYVWVIRVSNTCERRMWVMRKGRARGVYNPWARPFIYRRSAAVTVGSLDSYLIYRH